MDAVEFKYSEALVLVTAGRREYTRRRKQYLKRKTPSSVEAMTLSTLLGGLERLEVVIAKENAERLNSLATNPIRDHH